jgi:nucleoside-diphosphate-sugar epimerase
MSRAPQTPLRVLFVGGSGHIGQRWLATAPAQEFDTLSAFRRAAPGQARALALDVRDARQARRAVQGMDAVINGAAGSRDAIAEGTAHLCEAALQEGVRLVHLSTQSVYGPFEGWVQESMPLDPRQGWYGQAKCEAETAVRRFARQGGQAVILRPGCVGGPGSALWVGRIAGWLRSGRLGDLGAAGDGWSNLAHVDDVCCALRQALSLPLRAGELPTFNLAAPDSPRWNDYFMDLALALRATPVARLSARRLWLDSHLLSPPLQAAQRLGQRLGLASRAWPQALPPGLARLWSQQIRLDSSAATAALGLRWTPYARLLDASVRWLLHSGPGAPARSDLEAKLRP